MEPTFELTRGMHELTDDELREIRGGGDGLKSLFWHGVRRAVDCMIDEWDRMQECFREGMAEAKN